MAVTQIGTLIQFTTGNNAVADLNGNLSLITTQFNALVTGTNTLITGLTLPSPAISGSVTWTGTIAGDLLFTDATYDIGKSGATRPRDFFASRNAVIGGTLTLGGALTSTSSAITLGSGFTTENQTTTLTLNCGTNTGANNKDAYTEYQLGGTAQIRFGIMGSVVVGTSLGMFYDVPNSKALGYFGGTSGSASLVVGYAAALSPTSTYSGFTVLVCGTASGANTGDTYHQYNRGSVQLWKHGVMGSLVANANWTLRDFVNSVSPIIVAPGALGTGTITTAVEIVTIASASAGAGLRLPHGAAPSAPGDGDMWTTSAGGLFVRINGVTKSVNLT